MNQAFEVGQHHVPFDRCVRGSGNIWPVSGWISGDLKNVKSIQILINGVATDIQDLFHVHYPIENIDFFNNVLEPGKWHFCHFIDLKSNLGNRIEVQIQLTLHSDRQFTIPFCESSILDQIHAVPESLPPAKYAICMTTYNPNPDLFKSQLNSIIHQSESSWQLVINDDKSDPNIFKYIKNLTLHDDRVHLFQNKNNLGFYYNFESAICRVYRQFDYIALADQDDIWYPNKLKSLVSCLDNKSLSYCDLEIMDDRGKLISPTFWNYRSNHYKDLPALFLANTVTGSASLFSSNILNKLIPFPAKLGNAFHDHWLALVASVDRGISYVDEPLQAYIQHQNNVTGYGQFNSVNMGYSSISLLSLQRMKAAVTLRVLNSKNHEFMSNNLKVYFDAYLRRKLQYQTIISRFPHVQNNKLDNIFDSKMENVRSLLKLHWKIYKLKWMTNNAELSYINALEVMKLLRINL